jgi:hypothetical protein
MAVTVETETFHLLTTQVEAVEAQAVTAVAVVVTLAVQVAQHTHQVLMEHQQTMHEVVQV